MLAKVIFKIGDFTPQRSKGIQEGCNILVKEYISQRLGIFNIKVKADIGRGKRIWRIYRKELFFYDCLLHFCKAVTDFICQDVFIFPELSSARCF